MGRGHIFAGISSGKRVCTLFGFSKSEAIFASSLLVEIPTFTVIQAPDKSYPLSHRLLLWDPVDQGSSSHVQKYLINRKGFHCRSIRFTNCFKCLGILRVKAKITRYTTRFGHFRRAIATGSPVCTPYFLGRNGFRNYDSRYASWDRRPLQTEFPADPAHLPLLCSLPPRKEKRCSHQHEKSIVPYRVLLSIV